MYKPKSTYPNLKCKNKNKEQKKKNRTNKIPKK